MTKKIDNLTIEEQEQVIEKYLGVNPRYFIYRGISLEVDIYNNRRAGNKFNGFLPDLKAKGMA